MEMKIIFYPIIETVSGLSFLDFSNINYAPSPGTILIDDDTRPNFSFIAQI